MRRQIFKNRKRLVTEVDVADMMFMDQRAEKGHFEQGGYAKFTDGEPKTWHYRMAQAINWMKITRPGGPPDWFERLLENDRPWAIILEKAPDEPDLRAILIPEFGPNRYWQGDSTTQEETEADSERAPSPEVIEGEPGDYAGTFPAIVTICARTGCMKEADPELDDPPTTGPPFRNWCSTECRDEMRKSIQEWQRLYGVMDAELASENMEVIAKQRGQRGGTENEPTIVTSRQGGAKARGRAAMVDPWQQTARTSPILSLFECHRELLARGSSDSTDAAGTGTASAGTTPGAAGATPLTTQMGSGNEDQAVIDMTRLTRLAERHSKAAARLVGTPGWQEAVVQVGAPLIRENVLVPSLGSQLGSHESMEEAQELLRQQTEALEAATNIASGQYATIVQVEAPPAGHQGTTVQIEDPPAGGSDSVSSYDDVFMEELVDAERRAMTPEQRNTTVRIDKPSQ